MAVPVLVAIQPIQPNSAPASPEALAIAERLIEYSVGVPPGYTYKKWLALNIDKIVNP